jgi:hypothetical protein
MKSYLLLLSGILLITSITQASTPMPYKGQEQRQIKALSAAEIDGLLTGKGMGMAKPAELNHYPGPLHVLELADQIGLSKEQVSRTRTLYKDMKHEATLLGEQIVKEEQKLDGLFSSGKVNDELLKDSLNEIARLRGGLRFVHLQAHLRQKAILSTEQIHQYDRLRGYMKHHGHHAH